MKIYFIHFHNVKFNIYYYYYYKFMKKTVLKIHFLEAPQHPWVSSSGWCQITTQICATYIRREALQSTWRIPRYLQVSSLELRGIYLVVGQPIDFSIMEVNSHGWHLSHYNNPFVLVLFPLKIFQLSQALELYKFLEFPSFTYSLGEMTKYISNYTVNYYYF